ncbi:MAG: UDP-glucose 4-epimerase GalE [Acidothermaceae bacterium]
MAWLLTGGAGYIGAHVVRAMIAGDHQVVVLDDLSSGHREFVPNDVTFVIGSVTDAPLVRTTLSDHRIDGVIHLAGYKYAGESVKKPLHTYTQNVVGAQVLIQECVEAGVEHFVFSSSAAVYGTPDVDIVDEHTATHPESPYGESKLITEWLLRDVARVTTLQQTSLRYFNVVGSAHADIYDSSPHNLFPLVFRALVQGRRPCIYGTDYPTADGTCVRDYVDVGALAQAHVAAATALAAGRSLEPVYNLGSGAGSSVRQIMEAIGRGTGIDFEPDVAPRRPGDPARIVASGERAARDLGWNVNQDLDAMVAGAWKAFPKQSVNV